MGSSGHATVVRLIDNAEMSAAAEKIARRLNFSGMHGFDFMLEAHTGNAYLIEINPRSTQVGHLTLGLGRDIPAALYLSGVRTNSSPSSKRHPGRHDCAISAGMDSRPSQHVFAIGLSRCSLGQARTDSRLRKRTPQTTRLVLPAEPASGIFDGASVATMTAPLKNRDSSLASSAEPIARRVVGAPANHQHRAHPWATP